MRNRLDQFTQVNGKTTFPFPIITNEIIISKFSMGKLINTAMPSTEVKMDTDSALSWGRKALQFSSVKN